MRLPVTCSGPVRVTARPFPEMPMLQAETQPPSVAVQESPAVQLENLTVEFVRRDRQVKAVNGVSLTLMRGEILTILGESGSGKSVTLRALMGLMPDYAR